MPSYLTRLAVGLLHHRPYASQSERSQGRIDLALKAAGAGFALVEIFETGDNGLREDVAFQELEIVARQVDAAAVVWGGSVDEERVRELAWRLRMVVVPAVDAMPTPGARSNW